MAAAPPSPIMSNHRQEAPGQSAEGDVPLAGEEFGTRDGDGSDQKSRGRVSAAAPEPDGENDEDRGQNEIEPDSFGIGDRERPRLIGD